MKHLNKAMISTRRLSASTIASRIMKHDFSQADRLLIEVYAFSGKPVTRNMLSDKTGIRLTSVCARIRQLLDYDLLDISGNVYCPLTGKLVTSLCCTPEGEALALCLLNGNKREKQPDKRELSFGKRNVGLSKQYNDKKRAAEGIWL